MILRSNSVIFINNSGGVIMSIKDKAYKYIGVINGYSICFYIGYSESKNSLEISLEISKEIGS